MSSGPKVVCAGCGIEIPLGMPLRKECAADVQLGVLDAPRGFCPITLDQYGNQTSLITKRKAIANPNQQPASIELIRDLARLTSYRLWNARAQLHDRQVRAEVAA